MQRFAIAILLLSTVFISKFSQTSQTGIQFVQPQVEYQFGSSVTFSVDIQSESSTSIQGAFLHIQSEGENALIEALSSNGAQQFTLTINPNDINLHPFSKTTYWFSATASDGSSASSSASSFNYIDNRFNWQEMDASPFQIYWVEGDLTFAQEVSNAATSGLVSIKKLLPLDLTLTPLSIYVYPHSSDLQQSLGLESEKWVGGHASPQQKLILVSLPADQDQQILMEQQIPHELAHVLLYQKMGATYTNLPVWFSEGFASSAELYPNSDYAQALDKAVQNSSLLSMASLCQSFPQDTADVYLAYAESESFVRYLHQTYGSTGLETLIQNYADGLGCSEAIQTSYHISLDSLENQWKQQSLGMDLAGIGWHKLLPYLIILAVLLIFTLLPGIIFLSNRNKS